MGAAGTLVAAVLATPIYSAVYAADPDPVVVLPGLGPVAGKTLDGDVSVFLGLPFAAPPTGDLRWMPPQPHGGWGSATLNATVFGASCPQGSLGERSGDGRQRQGREDGRVIDMGCGRVEHEDCLFLNVAAPTATLSSADSKLPVMIWIHGGGYQEGDSCEYRIESLAAASHGSVIVVSVNYRCVPVSASVRAPVRVRVPVRVPILRVACDAPS
jgi:carboxylesterase type B